MFQIFFRQGFQQKFLLSNGTILNATSRRSESGSTDSCKTPEKDLEKSMNLNPWIKILSQLKEENLNQQEKKALEELFWFVEEYRVSLFAPEVKTPVPVSPRRLEKFTRQHFPRHPLIFTAGPY